MHLCDRYAVAFYFPRGTITRKYAVVNRVCVDLYPNRYMNKRERLGTWVLSQAPGRFLDFFGYFHAALEGKYHCAGVDRHMVHCSKP